MKTFVTHHHIISSLGFDTNTNFEHIKNKISGIEQSVRESGESCYTSLVDKEKLDVAFSKIGNIETFTTLEKMMILSVSHILAQSKLNISNKTGLIVATTKGNIDVLSSKNKFNKSPERAYLSELGEQIQNFFGFENKPIILSNACVSGVLAIAIAKRLIQSKQYDDVIVVGGDLVTEFILSGFHSFQAISAKPCKPFSKNRDGITIGEAVGSVLVSNQLSSNAVEILGTASCNDANHISGPSRTGEGLFLSVNAALKESGINVDKIDFISAHGTATLYNDEMEAIAFDRLNMNKIPLHSLKGYYGHTLGAAGLIESIIGIKSLQENTLVSSLGYDQLGVSKNINIIKNTKIKELNVFLKTASGFGGCNTAVLFKKR